MCVLLTTCVRHAVHVRPVPHQDVHHPVFAGHGGAPEWRHVMDGPEIFLRMSNIFLCPPPNYLSSWTSYSPRCSRLASQALTKYSTISTFPFLHAINSGEQPSRIRLTMLLLSLFSTRSMRLRNEYDN